LPRAGGPVSRRKRSPNACNFTIIAKSQGAKATIGAGERRLLQVVTQPMRPLSENETAVDLKVSSLTGRRGFDVVSMCSEKSGTGVEREPDAESLLARGAFGSPQLLRNLGRSGLLARHRFQLTELA
jgi:hypothetical protein